MKTFTQSLLVIAMLGTSSVSFASGLEYSKQSVSPLFEAGNYAELSYAYVKPEIKGKDNASNNIDNMLEDYGMTDAAVKIAPTEDTGLMLTYSQPWGVDTAYPTGNDYHNQLGTTKAKIQTDSIGLVGGGKIGSKKNIWLYGGLDYQKLSGKVTTASPVGRAAALQQILPIVASSLGLPSYTAADYAKTQLAAQNGDLLSKLIVSQVEPNITAIAPLPTYYTLDFKDSSTLVPMVGMAYEKPEIALRAAVTYRAPAKYQVNGTENVTAILPVSESDMTLTKQTLIPATTATTEVKFPQSVNLDFQTGLSEKYRLLGMINARWVDWSNFKVTPTVAQAVNGEPLASYTKDEYAIEMALGKEFSPKFSGEVRLGYDTGTGDPLSLLGPYGVVKSIGLGGQYKVDKNLAISGGVQYFTLAGGKVSKLDGTPLATVDDGQGVAIGAKLGYHF